MVLVRDYIILAAVLAIVLLLAPIVALSQAQIATSKAGDVFLAIGPDPLRYEYAADQNDGRVIGPVQSRWSRLLAGSSSTQVAMSQSGAWFVVSATALRAICGFPQQDQIRW